MINEISTAAHDFILDQGGVITLSYEVETGG